MILLIMEEWNLVNEAGYAQCCRLFLYTQCHTHAHTSQSTSGRQYVRNGKTLCLTSSCASCVREYLMCEAESMGTINNTSSPTALLKRKQGLLHTCRSRLYPHLHSGKNFKHMASVDLNFRNVVSGGVFFPKVDI